MKSIRELLTVVDAYGQPLSEGPIYDMLIKNGATPANAKAMAQAQGETNFETASSVDNTNELDLNPRPTENADGDDPYGIINARQAVEAGQTFRQADLNRGLAELKADQDAWDEENPDAKLDANKPVDPNRPGGNNNPFKNTTDRYAWINAGKPDIWPPTDAAQTGTDTTEPEVATDNDEVGGDGMTDVERQAGAGQATTATEPEVATGTAATDVPTSRLDTKGETPPATDTPATEPAASNGSLLGRKLDTTTPNLMKAYNDGGKQAMPTIRNMQTALSRLGFDPNGLDGKYGPGTFKAVQAFQKANGLTVDGQAGPNTMAAIKKALDDKFEKNKVTPADSAQAAAPRSNASGDPAESGSTGVQPRANSAVNKRADAPTVQIASKDNNMNKNKINEASMNISMNGQNAQEISDLMRMMQLAGAKEATPVSALHKGPVDGHDDMVSLMQIANDEHEGHDDSPCGMGEEGVEEEWNNSPNEEYGDLSDAIPAGNDMHKKKKAYAATQPGDNAMAVETSIKEALWAALSEKQTTEGRGRGKKMKLKASRGNEDTKTTEGSRGKKSRGKKSRG